MANNTRKFLAEFEAAITHCGKACPFYPHDTNNGRRCFITKSPLASRYKLNEYPKDCKLQVRSII